MCSLLNAISEIKMFRFDMFVMLILTEVLGGLSALPTLNNSHKDMRCISKQTIQRHSPSKYSKEFENESERRQYCLVDEYYTELDIYPCDKFFQKSVKLECLMCGQHKSIWKSLCRNRNDDPSTVLTCEYCRRFANPCQNNGIAICGLMSYASELKCSCPSGYTGEFCEDAIEEVVYICALEEDDDEELIECHGNQFTNCRMTFNGRYYKCNKEEDDYDVKLPRCDTIPLPVEGSVEYSADGTIDIDDESTIFENLETTIPVLSLKIKQEDSDIYNTV